MTVFSVVVPDRWAFEFDAAAMRLMDDVLANNPELEATDTNLGQAKSALLQMIAAEYFETADCGDFFCDDCSELPFELPDEEPPL